MSQLPQGWTREKLSDVAEVQMGQSPKGEFVNQDGEGIPFYQGKAEFGKLYPTPKKACTKPTRIAQRNDILMSIRAPVGPTNYCPEESCIGRGLAGIRAKDGLNQHYLLHYLRSIEPWMSQQGTGSTFKAISGKFLKDVEVLLAPEKEQKRIADKLDSVLAKVETAQARLDKIPTILKRFRQSVLAAATSGELTKDWREENGVQFDFKEYGFDEILTELRNGLSSKPNEDGKGTPILRISSVRAMEIDQQDIRYIELSDKELERYMLCEGDLLFTRYNGSLEFVGVCGLLTTLEHENLVYPDKLIRARLNEKALPQFIEILFSSPEMREQVTGCVKTTSGQKGISGKNLKDQIVKLPSISEQQEIVRQVSNLLSKADRVEHKYLNSKLRLDSLTQSILSKAFSGKL